MEFFNRGELASGWTRGGPESLCRMRMTSVLYSSGFEPMKRGPSEL